MVWLGRSREKKKKKNREGKRKKREKGSRQSQASEFLTSRAEREEGEKEKKDNMATHHAPFAGLLQIFPKSQRNRRKRTKGKGGEEKGERAVVDGFFPFWSTVSVSGFLGKWQEKGELEKKRGGQKKILFFVWSALSGERKLQKGKMGSATVLGPLLGGVILVLLGCGKKKKFKKGGKEEEGQGTGTWSIFLLVARSSYSRARTVFRRKRGKTGKEKKGREREVRNEPPLTPNRGGEGRGSWKKKKDFKPEFSPPRSSLSFRDRMSSGKEESLGGKKEKELQKLEFRHYFQISQPSAEERRWKRRGRKSPERFVSLQFSALVVLSTGASGERGRGRGEEKERKEKKEVLNELHFILFSL